MRKLLLSALALTAAFSVAKAQFYVIEASGELDGYAWDAAGGTNVLTSNVDDVYSTVQNLPFTWDFYGQSVSQYLVSDNGYITFDVTATTSTGANTGIPNATGPNNAIYAAWDDLALVGAGTPDVVKTYTMGSMPNRTHVIQWHSVSQVAGQAGAYLYAAILIHESGDFDVVIPWAAGTTAGFTIGCEDATGSEGVEVSGSPNIAFGNTTSDPTDDLIYHFVAGEQPDVDAKMNSATIPTYASPGGSSKITGVIQNLGSQTLTSFDIVWTDGTVTNTHSVSAAVASGAIYAFEHPDEIILNAGSTATIEVSVVAANDENPDNNSVSDDVDGLVFVPTKRVVGEEATGTWCGWCPRGMVGMEYMKDTYPGSWIGIAVHNNDPMENSDYDSWMGTQISGYPSGLVDREGDIDPNQGSFESNYNNAIQKFGLADIEIWPLIDDNDEVELRVRFHFAKEQDDDMRVAVIIVEDGLTGSGSQWAQANYYSGGGSGQLSGAGFNWHNEGSYVYGVTYNDVGRDLLTDPEGDDDIVTAPVAEGEAQTYVWDKFDWNEDYDKENSRIVVLLIDDDNDEIINANEAHLMEYEIVDGPNGEQYYVIEGDTYEFWDGGEDLVPTGIGQAVPANVEVNVYPNPAQDQIFVAVAEEAEVLLVDMTGKVVASANNTGTGSGVQFDARELSAGIYNVVVKTNNSMVTERVTVIK